VIRGLVRLSAIGALGAFAVDRWLARRPEGSKPVEIVSAVEIAAPPEAVWAVLADIESQPEWMHDLKLVQLLTPPPIGVGTRAVGTVRILGITVEDPVEITAFEPPSRYAIVHEGLFAGTGVIELSPTASGTHVRWVEVLVPPVLPHFGALVQRPILGAVFQADIERLRDLVERRPASHPAGAGNPARTA